MSESILAINPAIQYFGGHDPSAAIFKNGKLRYFVEEERFSRNKHAENTFPEQSVRASLEYCNINLSDVDSISIPWVPPLQRKVLVARIKEKFFAEDSTLDRLQELEWYAKAQLSANIAPLAPVKDHLRNIGEPLPPLKTYEHHRCHAASAFYPANFEEGIILTIDAGGEYDSTVVWHGTNDGLKRIKTYKSPNSLGRFYSIVTEFLGYHAFNGEGKVMGLAPYGSQNESIEEKLKGAIEIGREYDVTNITKYGFDHGVKILEDVLEKQRKTTDTAEFDDWEQDLAYTAQSIVEKIVCEIVDQYCSTADAQNVALAGGVALNCKMNKRIMELDRVNNLFVQPVANDAGSAIGAGILAGTPNKISQMTTAYWGPQYSNITIRSILQKTKIQYSEPDNLERYVTKELSEGAIVGWFQGRLEMGPRALGNRSILVDPRTAESRDRVNKYVKHREEWRPFAPSLLESAASTYLIDGRPAPFMIRTFEVRPERRDEMEAVLHPADNTTRPQTVNKDQNPRYYKLISAFEEITGVPVLLNTSFNDHGEPIVNRPIEAIKDFYAMGMDLLVINDFVVEK